MEDAIQKKVYLKPLVTQQMQIEQQVKRANVLESQG